MIHGFRNGLLLTVMLLAAGAPRVQSSRSLGEPTWRLPQSFSTITSIRELSDGRVLVADAQEHEVYLADPRSGVVKPVSRRGNGPGEFQHATVLLPIPGDTTLLYDGANHRYLVLSATGTPVGTRTAEAAQGSTTLGGVPAAIDASRRIYAVGNPMAAAMSSGRLPDAAPLLRSALGGSREDTVATLKLPVATMNVGGRMLRGVTSSGSAPFAAQDEWDVTPSGAVAVVRVAPYRVEWISPTGTITTGPTVPYEPLRVTAGDQRDFDASQKRSSGGMRVGADGRGTPFNGAPTPVLPDVKPPFIARDVKVSSRGEVWVKRTYASGDATTMCDVFDGSGTRLATVRIPSDAHVVGFGKDAVYLSRTDADGLQTLERYRY
jgi:hypothetical protein